MAYIVISQAFMKYAQTYILALTYIVYIHMCAHLALFTGIQFFMEGYGNFLTYLAEDNFYTVVSNT